MKLIDADKILEANGSLTEAQRVVKNHIFVQYALTEKAIMEQTVFVLNVAQL